MNLAIRRHCARQVRSRHSRLVKQLMIRPLGFVLLVAVAVCLSPQAALAAPALDGASMRWPWLVPFIGILLFIAAGPLLVPKIWHRHYGNSPPVGLCWRSRRSR
jgi:Putative citrate transport